MSEQTKAAFEAALQAHIADAEDNDSNPLITGWIITASLSYIDGDQDTYSYWFESADVQPAHVTRGLASLLTDWSDGVTVVHMTDEDDN